MSYKAIEGVGSSMLAFSLSVSRAHQSRGRTECKCQSFVYEARDKFCNILHIII